MYSCQQAQTAGPLNAGPLNAQPTARVSSGQPNNAQQANTAAFASEMGQYDQSLKDVQSFLRAEMAALAGNNSKESSLLERNENVFSDITFGRPVTEDIDQLGQDMIEEFMSDDETISEDELEGLWGLFTLQQIAESGEPTQPLFDDLGLNSALDGDNEITLNTESGADVFVDYDYQPVDLIESSYDIEKSLSTKGESTQADANFENALTKIKAGDDDTLQLINLNYLSTIARRADPEAPLTPAQTNAGEKLTALIESDEEPTTSQLVEIQVEIDQAFTPIDLA